MQSRNCCFLIRFLLLALAKTVIITVETLTNMFNIQSGQFHFLCTNINSISVINADATLKLTYFISCMYCSEIMIRK